MKRTLILSTVFTAVLVLVLPFIGGGGPSFLSSAHAAPVSTGPAIASLLVVDPSSSAISAATQTIDFAAAAAAPTNVDSEHVAQKPVPKPLPPVSSSGRASGTVERRAALEAAGASCPGNVGGSTGGAPGITSDGGVGGTTSDDLASFAATYNQIRVDNCLNPVPLANFRYDSCMESRLFWMAEDPSEDPASAWGHKPQTRSDGVPDTGCDGNLAGGSGNSGATVATKWWNSAPHRLSLYRPSYAGSTGGVCIYFAMSHGGIPNEAYSFTRAAARWGGC
ncbi:MAG: hypothetical protein ABI435_05375 [Pseudolysinimonas sp.]